MNNSEVSKKTKSLNNYIESIILNYTDTIDYDNEIELYDKLVIEFFNGNLDREYESELFDNMSLEDKLKILSIVHKYQSLCFYENSIEYWADSVYGVPVDDYKLIVYQLLDNFELLVKLYLTGGEDSLALLNNYASSKYRNIEMSCVENIRMNFVNDDVLVNVFKNLSDEESLFDIFTDNEKNALLEYPEGTLYFYSQEGVEIIDPMFVALELYYRINGTSYQSSERDEFIKISSELTGFFKNEDNFIENVQDMFYEYQLKLSKNTDFEIIDDKVIKGINLVNLRDNWIIQDKGLLDDIDSSIDYKSM